MTTTLPGDEERRAALRRLGLFGLLSHWEEVRHLDWVQSVIDCEQSERQRRSLQRRLRSARLGSFKPLCDFDWQWPKKIDRDAIEELSSLDFLCEPANVVLIGPNSTGKTTIAKNLAHLALLGDYTARFTTASAMLNDLAAQDSASALNRRLRHYCRPSLLVCDELGYLSYDARYADLLFEVVTRRYQQRATIITTNKPFSEWNQVFPNGASVVTIIDRLVHKSEIVTIEGDSYCLKRPRNAPPTRPAAASSASPVPPHDHPELPSPSSTRCHPASAHRARARPRHRRPELCLPAPPLPARGLLRLALPRRAPRLYVLLVLAADRHGVSFYHYDSLCSLLELPLESYLRAPATPSSPRTSSPSTAPASRSSRCPSDRASFRFRR